MSLPGQLLFDFPPQAPALSDLVISPSNQAAMKLVSRPEAWPMPLLCLTGPRKCGLTTIAHIWCSGTSRRFAACDQADFRQSVPELFQFGGAIDNADRVKSEDEDLLLSVLNSVSLGAGRLLLTAHSAPATWPVASRDLASRLKSMPVAEILPPDEAMLRGRLAAAGARRFFRFEDETLNFLVPRLDLTYETVENVVEAVSRSISDTGRGPTIPLVRDALEGMDKSAQSVAADWSE